VVLNYRTVLAIVATSTMMLAAGCGSVAARDGATNAGTLAGDTSANKPNGAIPSTPASASITLKEDGSTLLLPLFSAWATEYHKLFGAVTISANGGGSGQGISDASAGKVDIGASDAFLSSGNLVQNPNMLNIPLAVAGQEINYNVPDLRPAGAHINLNGKVLAAIYEGKIRNWDAAKIADLNKGVTLPNLAIVPLHRGEPTGAGDTFLFSSFLSTEDPNWYAKYGFGSIIDWPSVPGAKAETGNDGMVAGCQATRGCIAYIGISDFKKAEDAGLGDAALRNAFGNFVTPSATSMIDAVNSFVSATPDNETISMINGPAPDAYPIVNYEYAIVSKVQRSAIKARDIKAFLNWAVNTKDAKSFLAGVQFQPLPGPIATLANDQIASIR
jgi:phosphate transport system substrate-binding protein